MPMKWVQKYDHQIYTPVRQMLSFNLSDILKTGVLEQIWLAITGFVTNMTKLSMIRSALEMTDQSRQPCCHTRCSISCQLEPMH